MTDDRGSIERSIFIRASQETVFRFLVEPDLLDRWIGRALFARAEAGEAFGVKFTSGSNHVAAGVFTEIAPPHRLAFTFGWDGQASFPPGESLVVIELEPYLDGTMLNLRHSGLPGSAPPGFTPGAHRERWAHYLSRLAEAALAEPIAIGPGPAARNDEPDPSR